MRLPLGTLLLLRGASLAQASNALEAMTTRSHQSHAATMRRESSHPALHVELLRPDPALDMRYRVAALLETGGRAQRQGPEDLTEEEIEKELNADETKKTAKLEVEKMTEVLRETELEADVPVTVNTPQPPPMPDGDSSAEETIFMVVYVMVCVLFLYALAISVGDAREAAMRDLSAAEEASKAATAAAIAAVEEAKSKEKELVRAELVSKEGDLQDVPKELPGEAPVPGVPSRGGGAA